MANGGSMDEQGAPVKRIVVRGLIKTIDAVFEHAYEELEHADRIALYDVRNRMLAFLARDADVSTPRA